LIEQSSLFIVSRPVRILASLRRCSLFSSFVIGNWLLTGPAGLKTLPCGAVERLLTGKLGGILTYFQRKVNKISHEKAQKTQRIQRKKASGVSSWIYRCCGRKTAVSVVRTNFSLSDLKN